MNITPKPVKVFTREKECSKLDLHNCFCQDGRYCPRAVVEARGEIGLNAIKYLKKKDLAVAYEQGGIDWWKLTPDGEEWLRKGLARHMELHPEDAGKSNSMSIPVVRRRRTRKP